MRKLLAEHAGEMAENKGKWRATERNMEPAKLPDYKLPNPLILLLRVLGWETWIRTKINGVRVRCSTIELFPNSRRALDAPAGKAGPL